MLEGSYSKGIDLISFSVVRTDHWTSYLTLRIEIGFIAVGRTLITIPPRQLLNDFGKIYMGGFGSGNWHRQRSHATVDALPELCALDFKNPSGEVVAKPRDELSRRAVAFRYVRSGQDVVLFRSGPSRKTNTDTI